MPDRGGRVQIWNSLLQNHIYYYQLHPALQTVSFNLRQAKNSLLTLASLLPLLLSPFCRKKSQDKKTKSQKPYLLCRRPNVNIPRWKSFVKTWLGFRGALHYFFSEVRVAGDGGIYPECLFWGLGQKKKWPCRGAIGGQQPFELHPIPGLHCEA